MNGDGTHEEGNGDSKGKGRLRDEVVFEVGSDDEDDGKPNIKL